MKNLWRRANISAAHQTAESKSLIKKQHNPLGCAACEEAFHADDIGDEPCECATGFQRSMHYLLGLVPHFRLSQELLGPGGQVEFEGEAKHVVHGSQEVQAAFDLRLDLGKDAIKGNMDRLSGSFEIKIKKQTKKTLRFTNSDKALCKCLVSSKTLSLIVSLYLLC